MWSELALSRLRSPYRTGAAGNWTTTAECDQTQVAPTRATTCRMTSLHPGTAADPLSMSDGDQWTDAVRCASSETSARTTPTTEGRRAATVEEAAV
jgi:hypothetical protein